MQKEDRDIVRLWLRHPTWYAREVATTLGVNPSKVLALYPFPQYLTREMEPTKRTVFRANQIIHAILSHPKWLAAKVMQVNGFSSTGMGRAKKAIKKYGLTLQALPQEAQLSLPLAPAPTPATQPPVPVVATAESNRSAATTDVAKQLTAERGKLYGHPLDSFSNIAFGSEVVSQCKDPEVRVALDMIWIKICRLIETPDHADSIDDIKGYAETINMIHAERKVRGVK